ncbi:hypothetical protein MIND_00439200 [Mycena indigotica]|uniref:Mucoidy inhibitor A n=1 Tax=Mycena indigotica TaxID=2126181 RepID=A0A8H6W5F6_9AGAR|nr:uncharacterized protein MIND_00439200 [Mycena indigotica]KAF7306479.1 hypothetical protein MIND_00439200 [Mycena indigotica]
MNDTYLRSLEVVLGLTKRSLFPFTIIHSSSAPLSATIIMTSDPPTFEPTTVTLKSLADSSIVGVNLYSSRAEVTRLFKLKLAAGHNTVKVVDLPSSLESETLRVEGRGSATIHDVAVKRIEREHTPTLSHKLNELNANQEEISDALARTERSIATLKQYLNSLNVQHLPVTDLDDVLLRCEATGERLDRKKKDLKADLDRLDDEIALETDRLYTPQDDEKLRMSASVGVFAAEAGDVEIALIYTIPDATWTAFYNIRVDMNTEESSVKLIYKAAVTQNTGEPWDNVPLQLETSTPTFGLGLPTLNPWNLSVGAPPSSSLILPAAVIPPPPPPLARAAPAPMVRTRRAAASSPVMAVASTFVSSKGNISATFRVPGLVSIPCDGQAHNFTIVELDLKAAMSWVSVPKVDPKAHLSARVMNASEYTLLSGEASIYVDGSFISRSRIPPVSPQESFDCPLGLDPSVRITYHPVLKGRTQSGFYTKISTHTFSQRITVHNTKSVALRRLKIIDQIPTSQDSQIEVKLVNPPLSLPDNSIRNSVSNSDSEKQETVSLGNGITAQWDGADDANYDPKTLGLERKLNFVCGVPAQQKINLLLEWEVASPARALVVGL